MDICGKIEIWLFLYSYFLGIFNFCDYLIQKRWKEKVLLNLNNFSKVEIFTLSTYASIPPKSPLSEVHFHFVIGYLFVVKTSNFFFLNVGGGCLVTPQCVTIVILLDLKKLLTFIRLKVTVIYWVFSKNVKKWIILIFLDFIQYKHIFSPIFNTY